MITEIILIICAVTMTASGVYFVVQDIQAKRAKKKAIMENLARIQQAKEMTQQQEG